MLGISKETGTKGLVMSIISTSDWLAVNPQLNDGAGWEQNQTEPSKSEGKALQGHPGTVAKPNND